METCIFAFCQVPVDTAAGACQRFVLPLREHMFQISVYQIKQSSRFVLLPCVARHNKTKQPRTLCAGVWHSKKRNHFATTPLTRAPERERQKLCLFFVSASLYVLFFRRCEIPAPIILATDEAVRPLPNNKRLERCWRLFVGHSS